MLDGQAEVIAQLEQVLGSIDRAQTDIAAGLHDLVHSGVRHVVGSQYAGITVAQKNKAVSNVVATHSYPKVLDAIQNRCGEGPCVEAAWRDRVMRIDDLYLDERWPRYRRHALEETPIRSVVSYGLLADGDGKAALNFYADHPHAFDEESIRLGGVFAAYAALAWSMMRRQEQFRSALASRDTIGQAKGVIMERFDLDAVEAFDLLTRLSQQSNTRVIDIATALIESEHPLKDRRH